MNTTEIYYKLYSGSLRAVIDSRECKKGCIFFAIKGPNYDGNAFTPQALANGAEYAVVDNPEYNTGEQTILVDDTLQTLQSLARMHREILGIPVIGITGTNGKTTTKELVAAVLASRYNVLYTEGNLNNHIGVPLTLLRLTPDHDIAVIEMGASHKGDIAELTDIAQPNYGIITNIGRAHLEGFGTFDNLVSTKAELYEYIRNTEGTIFRKSGDAILQNLSQGIDELTYGSDDDAFIYVQPAPHSTLLSFRWICEDTTLTVNTNLVGTYNIDNAAAAIAAGCNFGIPFADIIKAIESYRPSNNRSQLHPTPSNTLIIDAYNANPDSMKAAISNFRELNASPKAVILGDMKELGDDSLLLHKEVVSELEASSFNQVFLCGEQFSQIPSPYPTFPTTRELAEHLKSHPLHSFHILLKASRSMAFEHLVDHL